MGFFFAGCFVNCGMIYLATNLKHLRKRRKKTQADIAGTLGITRPTLNGYENAVSEPKLAVLIALADYFRFTLHDLVRTDLSKLPESKLREREVQ